MGRKPQTFLMNFSLTFTYFLYKLPKFYVAIDLFLPLSYMYSPLCCLQTVFGGDSPIPITRTGLGRFLGCCTDVRCRHKQNTENNGLLCAHKWDWPAIQCSWQWSVIQHSRSVLTYMNVLSEHLSHHTVHCPLSTSGLV